MSSNNFYQMLEVSKPLKCNAVLDSCKQQEEEFCAEVEKAYRVKAKTSHPDIFPEAEKAEKAEKAREFMEFSEAKEVLCDPEKRKIYDSNLSSCTWPKVMTENEILELMELRTLFGVSNIPEYKYCIHLGGFPTLALGVLRSLNEKYAPSLPVFPYVMDLKQDLYEYITEEGFVTSRASFLEAENNCFLLSTAASFFSALSSSKVFMKNPNKHNLVNLAIYPSIAAAVVSGVYIGKEFLFSYFELEENDPLVYVTNSVFISGLIPLSYGLAGEAFW